jgi:hypothetical protein
MMRFKLFKLLKAKIRFFKKRSQCGVGKNTRLIRVLEYLLIEYLRSEYTNTRLLEYYNE